MLHLFLVFIHSVVRSAYLTSFVLEFENVRPCQDSVGGIRVWSFIWKEIRNKYWSCIYLGVSIVTGCEMGDWEVVVQVPEK
jgi:hypothetical protein